MPPAAADTPGADPCGHLAALAQAAARGEATDHLFAHLSLDERGHLLTEIPCRGCGYVLRGLKPGDACPECGEPIAASVRADLLRFTGRAYLTRVRGGLTIIFACVLVGALIPALWMAISYWGVLTGTSTVGALVWAAMKFIVPLLFLLGLWRVTAPDPALGARQQPRRAAWWCRGMMAAYLLTMLLVTLLQLRLAMQWGFPSNRMAMFGGGLLMNAMWYAMWFALMIVVGALATRIPNAGMVRDSHILKWGMTFAGALLIAGVGLFFAAPATHRKPSAPAHTPAPHSPTITHINPAHLPQNKMETLPDGTKHQVIVSAVAGGGGQRTLHSVTERFTGPGGATTIYTTVFDHRGNPTGPSSQRNAIPNGGRGFTPFHSLPRVIAWLMQLGGSLGGLVFMIWGLVLAWRLRRTVHAALTQAPA